MSVYRYLTGLIGLFAFLLQACATSPQAQAPQGGTGVVIEGIVISNELAYGVTDVMMNVPATGNYAGCGNIVARTRCSTSFPAVDYSANAVIITWKEHGEAHQTGEFVIKVPEHLDPTQPAWLQVIIFAPGQAGAKLVQN